MTRTYVNFHAARKGEHARFADGSSRCCNARPVDGVSVTPRKLNLVPGDVAAEHPLTKSLLGEPIGSPNPATTSD
jgi:hypothetical protein